MSRSAFSSRGRVPRGGPPAGAVRTANGTKRRRRERSLIACPDAGRAARVPRRYAVTGVAPVTASRSATAQAHVHPALARAHEHGSCASARAVDADAEALVQQRQRADAAHLQAGVPLGVAMARHAQLLDAEAAASTFRSTSRVGGHHHDVRLALGGSVSTTSVLYTSLRRDSGVLRHARPRRGWPHRTRTPRAGFCAAPACGCARGLAATGIGVREHPAIDMEDLAVQVARGVGGEEHGQRRDFVGVAEAAHRDEAQQAVRADFVRAAARRSSPSSRWRCSSR